MKIFCLLIFLLSAALYADPCKETGEETKKQPITAYQCRQKVRIMANQMRTQVEKKVRETVPGIFQKIKTLRQLYPYIDELERKGLECCKKGNAYSCCIEPLVQQMQLWDSEGICLP